jgi:hypothetical protein
MPFSCVFQLNNGALDAKDEVIFLEFLENVFGEFHANKVRFAKVLFNNRPAYLSSNCPCFPASKGTVKKGDKINAETKIAFFAADGEDIPYNRPFTVIEFE